MSQSNQRLPGIKVLFIYSEQDSVSFREIDEHLFVLKHRDTIESWEAHTLESWTAEIAEKKEGVDLYIFLISLRLLESDYAQSGRLRDTLLREKQARVVTILLDAVELEGTPFSEYQTLPEHGASIVSSYKKTVMPGIALALRELIIDIEENLIPQAPTGIESVLKDRGAEQELQPSYPLNVPSEVEMRDRQIEHLRVIYYRLKGEHDQLETEYERIRESGLEATRALEKENMNLRSEIGALRERHENDKSDLERMKSNYGRLKEEAQQKLDKLTERVRELNQRLSGSGKTAGQPSGRKSGLFSQ